MWFRQKRKTETGVDLRMTMVDLRDRPSSPLAPKPLMEARAYLETVLPEIVRRWETHCFCINPQFLKLASFDFRDYGIAPASLLDTECLVSRIILKKFSPQGPWTQEPDGGHRRFCCPQCSKHFTVWAEEYSIAMSVLSAKPIEPAPRAVIGRYAGSYHYFTGNEHELSKIADYRPADSVARYLDELTAT